jgi:hypothetical protein
VSRVLGAPHDPDGGTGKSAGEGEHLDTGIALEGAGRDDAVLDGISGTGTNSNGADHLENGTENHGLAVGNGSGRDRSGPRVGDIVLEPLVLVMRHCCEDTLTSTIVVGIEHGKEGADGEDIVVLGELGHCYGGAACCR